MKGISLVGSVLIALVLMTAPSCETAHRVDANSIGWGMVGGIAGGLIYDGGKAAWDYLKNRPPQPAADETAQSEGGSKSPN